MENGTKGKTPNDNLLDKALSAASSFIMRKFKTTPERQTLDGDQRKGKVSPTVDAPPATDKTKALEDGYKNYKKGIYIHPTETTVKEQKLGARYLEYYWQGYYRAVFEAGVELGRNAGNSQGYKDGFGRYRCDDRVGDGPMYATYDEMLAAMPASRSAERYGYNFAFKKAYHEAYLRGVAAMKAELQKEQYDAGRKKGRAEGRRKGHEDGLAEKPYNTAPHMDGMFNTAESQQGYDYGIYTGFRDAYKQYYTEAQELQAKAFDEGVAKGAATGKTKGYKDGFDGSTYNDNGSAKLEHGVYEGIVGGKLKGRGHGHGYNAGYKQSYERSYKQGKAAAVVDAKDREQFRLGVIEGVKDGKARGYKDGVALATYNDKGGAKEERGAYEGIVDRKFVGRGYGYGYNAAYRDWYKDSYKKGKAETDALILSRKQFTLGVKEGAEQGDAKGYADGYVGNPSHPKSSVLNGEGAFEKTSSDGTTIQGRGYGYGYNQTYPFAYLKGYKRAQAILVVKPEGYKEGYKAGLENKKADPKPFYRWIKTARDLYLLKYADGYGRGQFDRGVAKGKADGDENGYSDGRDAINKRPDGGAKTLTGMFQGVAANGTLLGMGYGHGYNEAYRIAYNAAHDRGQFENGFNSGFETGYDDGYGEGYNYQDYNDYNQRKKDDHPYEQGHKIGYKAGYAESYTPGREARIYDDGYNDGYEDGYFDGYLDGHSDGYREGYNDGYDESRAEIARLEDALVATRKWASGVINHLLSTEMANRQILIDGAFNHGAASSGFSRMISDGRDNSITVPMDFVKSSGPAAVWSMANLDGSTSFYTSAGFSGFTIPNGRGGTDNYNADATSAGFSVPDGRGGFDHFDSKASHKGYSTPDLNGGMTHYVDGTYVGHTNVDSLGNTYHTGSIGWDSGSSEPAHESSGGHN